MIALDNSTDGGYVTNGTLTFSHTVSGLNRILFVGIMGGTSDVLSGVTYNGVAMTRIGIVKNNNSDRYNYLYYLIAPATGAHNVVITQSGSDYINAGAVSYTGVLQTSPIDGSEASQTTGTAHTHTVTNSVSNDWVIMWWKAYASGFSSVGANTTSRLTCNFQCRIFDSNGAVPSGARSLIVNTTSSETTGAIMCGFKAVPDVTLASALLDLI